jgi:hypothetical protein
MRSTTRQLVFPGDVLSPAAQLLCEQHRALRGAEQEEGVDVGNVDTLAEHVDTEDHLKLSRRSA